jgi:hypothetical protein
VPDVLPAEYPAAGRASVTGGEDILDALPADGAGPPRRRRALRRVYARGNNGEVELLKNSVRIRQRGVLTRLSHAGGGDREILLPFITGIEFKDVGEGMLDGWGYIRFLHTAGGGRQLVPGLAVPPGSGLAGLFANCTRQMDALSKDEDTLMFGAHQRDDFVALKEAVEDRILEIHTR